MAVLDIVRDFRSSPATEVLLGGASLKTRDYVRDGAVEMITILVTPKKPEMRVQVGNLIDQVIGELTGFLEVNIVQGGVMVVRKRQ